MNKINTNLFVDKMIDKYILESVYDFDKQIINEVTEVFCRESPKSVAKIFDAIEMLDYEMMVFYSHRLKGSLAAIGATETSKKAALMQQYGNQYLLEEFRIMASELDKEINILINFFQTTDWFEKVMANDLQTDNK